MKRALALLMLAGCAGADARPVHSLPMAMVLVPAGEFVMGSSPEEAARIAALMAERKITSWYPNSPVSEAPPRRTKITKPFYMGATEVTLGDFRAFVADSGYVTDAERDGKGGDGKSGGKWTQKPEFTWKNMGYERADNLPVVNVSWNDATAFCRWLSLKEGKQYRLPTEAEWEYACRAGTSTRYFWGDEDEKRNEYAWTGSNSGGAPHPVAQLKPNAWGLYDMLGNTYEYCQDYFVVKPYDPAQSVDPQGPGEGTERVLRSGSWGTDPMHPRCAFRGGAGPTHRNMRDGFRVVRDVD